MTDSKFDVLTDGLLVFAARFDMLEFCLAYLNLTAEEANARVNWLLKQPDDYKKMVCDMSDSLGEIAIVLSDAQGVKHDA